MPSQQQNNDEQKRIYDYNMWDEQIARRGIIPFIHKCLVYEDALRDYRILRGGDCMDDLIEIMKDLASTDCRVMIFTQDEVKGEVKNYVREHVKIYKPDIHQKCAFYIKPINRRDIGFEIDNQKNIFTTAHGQKTPVTYYLKQIIAVSEYISVLDTYRKIRQSVKRNVGMTRGLPKDEYGILFRPGNRKQALVVNYTFTDDPAAGITGDTEINININIRLNNFTGPIW